MQLEDLDKLVLPWPAEGKPWDGLPMARIGLRAAFYFGDGHAETPRRALLGIVQDYIALAGGRLRAYQRAGDRKRLSATPDDPIDFGRLQDRVTDVGADWAIDLSAEDDPNVASLWSLVTVASHGSYLLAHFPLGAFEGAPRFAFRTLFQRWCAALDVGHAYAGLGLALPVSGRSTFAAIRHCGPYVMRFPGLDVDYPNSVARRCRTGIRAVNWLTAVDDARLERVGGAQRVLDAAGETVQTLEYDGGTIFMAGAAPQVGDAEAGVQPTAYASLGHELVALRADIPEAWFDPPADYRVPPGFVTMSGGSEAEPEELPALHFTQAWLGRFD